MFINCEQNGIWQDGKTALHYSQCITVNPVASRIPSRSKDTRHVAYCGISRFSGIPHLVPRVALLGVDYALQTAPQAVVGWSEVW
jgi:hypothetical protein